jgi:hypothetical protein
MDCAKLISKWKRKNERKHGRNSRRQGERDEMKKGVGGRK